MEQTVCRIQTGFIGLHNQTAEGGQDERIHHAVDDDAVELEADGAVHVVVLGDEIGTEIFRKVKRLIPEHGKPLRFLPVRHLPNVRKRILALRGRCADQLHQKLHFRLNIRMGHALIVRVQLFLGLFQERLILRLIVPFDFHK